MSCAKTVLNEPRRRKEREVRKEKRVSRLIYIHYNTANVA
jgi:hypothetical protein